MKDSVRNAIKFIDKVPVIAVFREILTKLLASRSTAF